MSERVRRIKKKRTSSMAKRVFLLVIIAIIAFFVWLVLFNQKPELIEEKILNIKNQETSAIFCFTSDCFLINIEGIAFKKSSRPSGNLLFLIEDKTEKDSVKIGENVMNPHTLKELLFLRKKITEELSVRLGSAKTYDINMTDYEFKTSEDWILKLSTTNNANATLEILKRALNELGSTRANLEYIDLRLATKVFYKMK